VFAGTVNETDPGYAEAFKVALKGAPNCEWVGQLDMCGLLSAIANADAVLSPSWFEVMSLINLFAHALGTPVISSVHTYDTDLLGTKVQRFVPEKIGDLARLLSVWHFSPRTEAPIEVLRSRAAAFTAQTWAGFDQWLAQLDNTSAGVH
jgi:glycosyltransferase involved in cell wall biosynthesis